MGCFGRRSRRNKSKAGFASKFKKPRLDVKILVDKEKGRVLFAEADGDFVAVLFSFLTLPLGTIARLIGKTQSKPANVGCFSSLYKSVMSLGSEHFYSKELKDILLHPRSSSGYHCSQLKINIDDTKAKYFACKYNTYICFRESSCPKFMSIYKNTKCPNPDCSGSLSKVLPLEASSKGNVFVSKAVKFIITDDLEVKPIVPGTIIGLLNDFGISDMSVIKERIVKVGLNELLELLKLTLLSTTPLTDLFLSKKKLYHSSVPKKPFIMKKPSVDHSQEVGKMNVKVVLRKSTKELFIAEAGGDFIDFLFSLLVIPLGEVLHIMEGQSCLGSIDGLYKSVRSLDSKYFISEDQKNILLRPKLPPPSICKNRLFPLEATPVKCSIGGVEREMPVGCEVEGVPSLGGFIKEETSFFVSDNLVVTPLSAAASMSVMDRNNLSVSGLEEMTISIGMAEGIDILRASLNSNSALSNGLFHNKPTLKESEQEKFLDLLQFSSSE